MAGLLKMAGIFILRGAGGDQHERLLYELLYELAVAAFPVPLRRLHQQKSA